MDGTKVLEVTLPVEIVRRVEEMVASGEYADASDVLREGVEALAAEDETIERWLKQDVVPTYDAQQRDPSRAVPLAEVRRRMASLRATERMKPTSS